MQADSGWSEKLFQGDAAANAEFRDLTTLIASGGSDVDRALTGDIGDLPSGEERRMADTAEMLRGLGFQPASIRDVIGGAPMAKSDHELAAGWKERAMRSPDFTKRFLAGEPDAVREMMTANAVLSSEVRKEP
ncbi:hypothetical protein CSIRO_2776 [Bradyrhizobiaceae bacterium SG-6C]|nr:hypothetical protein CSIRO_2776 [Bradyrhizobiaceae bacterium SG-6C]